MRKNFRRKEYIEQLERGKQTLSTTFYLHNTPEDLWAYLSDVNLCDEVVGASPAISIKLTSVREGMSEVRMFSLPFGYYEEMPYEWLSNHYWVAERVIRRGGLKYFTFSLQLSRQRNHTQAILSIGYIAKWYFKKPFVYMAKQVLNKAKLFYEATDRFITESKTNEPSFNNLLNRDKNYKKQEISDLYEKLKPLDEDPTYANAIANFVHTAPLANVIQIRPNLLASLYRLEKMRVLKILLKAVEKGLFKMEWNVLCPNCNGITFTFARLSELNNKVHCETCNIKFDNKFANNIEITFRPMPSIIKINAKLYCFGDPARTPNVIAQFKIKPHEKRTIKLDLTNGDYEIRFSQIQKPLTLKIDDDGCNALLIDTESHQNEFFKSKPKALLTFINNADDWETLKIIAVKENKDIVTADTLSHLQEYRDLFGYEAMRPGITLEVKKATILFADIVNSVMMYEKYGDIKALSRIEDYFFQSAKIIQRFNGCIVKTVGDAIMAAFGNAEDALNAALEFHTIHTQYIEGNDFLTMRIALNQGPCLLLNSNNNLDYFGGVVNIASRALHHVSANETVITDNIMDDLGCQKILSNTPGLRISEEEVILKGLNKPTDLYKILFKSDSLKDNEALNNPKNRILYLNQQG